MAVIWDAAITTPAPSKSLTMCGVAYRFRAKRTSAAGSAAAALKHFKAVLAINPDLLEADMARNISDIEAALRKKL